MIHNQKKINDEKIKDIEKIMSENEALKKSKDLQNRKL